MRDKKAGENKELVKESNLY